LERRRGRAREPRSWARGAFDARLLLGIAAVPLAFIIANPFSILDARAFTSDFMYNLITTPVYGGKSAGNSYIEYWWHVIEIIGGPHSSCSWRR
jgi:hypothetical protein